MRTPTLVAAALLCLSGCDKKSDNRPSAYVECAAFINSIHCVVTHKSGPALNACWDVVMTCQNGTTLTAHGCQDVAPSGKAMKMIPESTIPNLKQCDSLVSFKVDNVQITAK
jgi:hypothetical protein